VAVDIKSEEWQGAKREDIYEVLSSVKDVLDNAFGTVISEDILVHTNLSGHAPIVLYERGKNQEYKIELSSVGTYWCQHAYQFAHEYCHIRTNYLSGSPKCKWFEESICELSSLYALRKMSQVWQENPPYENWREYAVALEKYATRFMTKPEHQLDKGLALETWLYANLGELEDDKYIRQKNAIIAIELLPLFECDMKLWNSMTYWNRWEVSPSDTIDKSFGKWYQIVPPENKSGLEAAMALMGFPIDSDT